MSHKTRCLVKTWVDSAYCLQTKPELLKHTLSISATLLVSYYQILEVLRYSMCFLFSPVIVHLLQSSVRYPVWMEASALAETCAGVRQTRRGSFATSRRRPLPDPLLTAARMRATRATSPHPTLCTLFHCPINKVNSEGAELAMMDF